MTKPTMARGSTGLAIEHLAVTIASGFRSPGRRPERAHRGQRRGAVRAWQRQLAAESQAIGMWPTC